ncbi:hypothetical protein NDU88_001059 [Pleurodeles waltl]|uniref:Uncharacterized protein n=1 Tax=Pleurodeles waltl TaxID=8319 RepID=A0AAV7VZ02_PLEWA|nr:hypothetical protein NDU88_001059 [Pleurodeles waltl]
MAVPGCWQPWREREVSGFPACRRKRSEAALRERQPERWQEVRGRWGGRADERWWRAGLERGSRDTPRSSKRDGLALASRPKKGEQLPGPPPPLKCSWGPGEEMRWCWLARGGAPGPCRGSQSEVAQSAYTCGPGRREWLSLGLDPPAPLGAPRALVDGGTGTWRAPNGRIEVHRPYFCHQDGAEAARQGPGLGGGEREVRRRRSWRTVVAACVGLGREPLRILDLGLGPPFKCPWGPAAPQSRVRQRGTANGETEWPCHIGTSVGG